MILCLFEWATGSKDNPLLHIDGNLNLADFLTKKHDIRVEDVSKGSDWIEDLEWVKRDRSAMPLQEHAYLRVEKPVIAEIMLECFPEPFTGKLSTTVVDPEPEREDLDEVQNDESDDDIEEMTILFSILALRAGKGVARELLVDPVYHGWRRALRIIGYLQSWASIHKHKSHCEIQWDCKIFMFGSSLWDPLVEVNRA